MARGAIQREMKSDRQIPAKHEAAGKTNSEGNAAISVGSHKIACFISSTLRKA